jgi:hypothetical protein
MLFKRKKYNDAVGLMEAEGSRYSNEDLSQSNRDFLQIKYINSLTYVFMD